MLSFPAAALHEKLVDISAWHTTTTRVLKFLASRLHLDNSKAVKAFGHLGNLAYFSLGL